ncbi:type 1 glutamine amidotransferase domain-containing protein [Actinospongicola halichondriae]|uniref:type 1 glutamine amidotransferase domain-containing protein n=1 Tax=Actinospongicola halichondriae TaxID=3236844 RepID=UPI003D49FAB9
MARIAIVLGPDFEDVEFSHPRDALVDAGHDVDIIGVEAATELTGKKGDVQATTDRAATDADPSDYEALVVPGGYSPDHLRTDGDLVGFVRKIGLSDVPVAAICHAGSLLIEAELVDGKRLTSWPSIKTDLQNAGARWVDEEVVVDGNLISSRNPDDLPAFCEALLRAIDGEES